MPATTFRILRPGDVMPVPADCEVTYVECRSSDGAIVLEVKAREGAARRTDVVPASALNRVALAAVESAGALS